MDGGGGATEDLENESEDVKEPVERQRKANAEHDTECHRDHHNGENLEQHESDDLVGGRTNGLQDSEFLSDAG